MRSRIIHCKWRSSRIFSVRGAQPHQWSSVWRRREEWSRCPETWCCRLLVFPEQKWRSTKHRNRAVNKHVAMKLTNLAVGTPWCGLDDDDCRMMFVVRTIEPCLQPKNRFARISNQCAISSSILLEEIPNFGGWVVVDLRISRGRKQQVNRSGGLM